MDIAKLLLGAEDPSDLAKHIMINRLSVHETDSFMKQFNPSKKERSRTNYIDPDLSAVAKQFQELTSMKVEIRPHTEQRGKIVFDYKGLSQLDAFLQKLSAGTSIDSDEKKVLMGSVS